MHRTHSRRRFLVVAGGTTAALGLGVGCSSSGQASGPVDAGNVSSVPVGYLAFVPGAAVVLGRDSGGLYAMTAICTHQQCDMAAGGSVGSNGVQCACHGARFSTNGAVVSGPAKSALEHYQVDLAASGAITVQASNVVSATTRTPVP
jgi:nitrite reductase/ring-hydroxylating ferredoxin subunit